MERKTFLKQCAVLGAGLVCLSPALAGCASLPYVPFTMDEGRAVVGKTDFDKAGFVLLDVETLPAPVLVTRLDAETYAAVLLRCTHRGCTVQPAGDILECPCHGSQYTPHGEVVKGPAPRNLRPYTVTTDAEHVHIALR